MDVSKSKPFISINKMAEYMTADPVRRRQIIKNLKKDSDFFKIYYSEVKNILKTYFKSNYDNNLIEETMSKIKDKTSSTDWDKNDNDNSIKALQHLMDSKLPDLTDYSFIKDTFNIKKIELGGVDITIKPKMYLKNNNTGKIGAIKDHIAKTTKNQLEQKNREYAATLLKYSFIANGFEEKDIDNNACISYDIFKKDYNTAPKSFKRTLSSIEAACEEIALRWDSI